MIEKINELTEILGKIKYLYDVWEKEKAHNPNMAIYVYMLYASGPCTQTKLAARYGIPKQTLNSNEYALLLEREINCFQQTEWS